MEMIKEGAIGDELKNQQGNFNFKATTIESHYVLVADQLFNCDFVYEEIYHHLKGPMHWRAFDFNSYLPFI